MGGCLYNSEYGSEGSLPVEVNDNMMGNNQKQPKQWKVNTMLTLCYMIKCHSVYKLMSAHHLKVHLLPFKASVLPIVVLVIVSNNIMYSTIHLRR